MKSFLPCVRKGYGTVQATQTLLKTKDLRRSNADSSWRLEHGVAEGIAIAREMLERVRPHVQGVQVSAPFGKVELALQVFRDTLAAAEARTA